MLETIPLTALLTSIRLGVSYLPTFTASFKIFLWISPGEAFSAFFFSPFMNIFSAIDPQGSRRSFVLLVITANLPQCFVTMMPIPRAWASCGTTQG